MELVPSYLTIRDVAVAAGVGVGTVSRVLNQRGYVSEATRTRVLAVMRRLQFRPHAQARRILGRRHTEMVCFLLSNRDFLHSFHARILQGVAACAQRLKQHVVYSDIHYSPETSPGRIPLPPILQERGWVDGLILAGTTYGNFIRRIQRLHIPFVALGNNVLGFHGPRLFDQVSFDVAKGTAEAIRYLLAQGHRRVAFVGDVASPWFAERHDCYLAVMRAARLAPLSCTLRPEKERGEIDYGEWAAGWIWRQPKRPTAVMAANDVVAYGLWRGLRRLGAQIPADVSLVGFDDRDEAMLMDPHLTTVRVHKAEIGEACMRMLLERLHNPSMPFSERVLATELIVRESVRVL